MLGEEGLVGVLLFVERDVIAACFMEAGLSRDDILNVQI